MKINIHAGHGRSGAVGCGAVSILNESDENRKVVAECISMLRSLGHTVYDCTIDNGTSAKDILQKIVAKCNANVVDIDISVHFNAGAADLIGNGRTTGTEVFLYSSSSPLLKTASNIVDSIAGLGFKNRGVKYSNTLYVLKNTKSPAMLIECCFVDDADDVKLYNAKLMAAAIVKGITGSIVPVSPVVPVTPAPTKTTIYRVQVGAYAVLQNASAMQNKLKAIKIDNILVKGSLNGKPIYRVQVGAYAEESNAIAMQNKLQKQYGIASIIVKN